MGLVKYSYIVWKLKVVIWKCKNPRDLILSATSDKHFCLENLSQTKCKYELKLGNNKMKPRQSKFREGLLHCTGWEQSVKDNDPNWIRSNCLTEQHWPNTPVSSLFEYKLVREHH